MNGGELSTLLPKPLNKHVVAILQKWFEILDAPTRLLKDANVIQTKPVENFTDCRVVIQKNNAKILIERWIVRQLAIDNFFAVFV